MASVVVGALLLFAASAQAQDESRGEVAGGWRFYHAAFASISPFIGSLQRPNDFPEGWFADVSFNLSPKFAIVGEAGGTYHDDSRSTTGIVSTNESFDAALYTFMGGVRVRAPQHEHLVPFGQVLVGGQHDTSTYERTTTVFQNTSTSRNERGSSSPVLALDGGVTMSAGVIGVRASAGYARFFSTADADAFRFSLGAVLRF